MKKLSTLLLLGGLLLLGVQNLFARDYDGNEKLYFNTDAVSYWKNDNAKLFVYFFNNTNSATAYEVATSQTDHPGDAYIYCVTVPEGSWTHLILTRNASDATDPWNNKWGQTGNIEIKSGNNIAKFSSGGTDATWTTYDVSATATNWYLNVDRGAGYVGTQFVKATEGASTASITLTNLAADETYYFYLGSSSHGGILKGEDIKVNSCTDVTLSSSGSNASFTTTIAGNYTFTLNTSNDHISIAYPTQTYTISMVDDGEDWESEYFKVYIWTTTPDDIHLTTNEFPGDDATSGSKSITTSYIPTNVILTDKTDGTHQTDNLPFINGAEYHGNGKVYQKVTLTAGNWASFSPSENVLIPEDDKLMVYRAELVDGAEPTLTAYPVEANKIKKGEGVLLKSTEDKTYSFEVTDDNVDELEDNSLKGSTMRDLSTVYKAGNSFLMVLEATTSNFVSYTGTYFPANKAYICYTPAPGAADHFRIIEGTNDATNVEDLDAKVNATKLFENGKLYILRDGVKYDAIGRIVR